MYKLTVFLILFVFATVSYSQVIFDKSYTIKDKITSEQLAQNQDGEKLFEIIGIANNKNIKHISLSPKSTVHIKALKDNAKNLLGKISIVFTDIEGDINYRDFMIDSVLYPSYMQANLNIYNGRHIVDTKKVLLQTDGSENTIDLSDYNHSRGEFSIELEEFNYGYNKENLESINNIIEFIKLYYSYGQLLDYINKQYSKFALQAEESTESIFIHKIELSQINRGLEENNYFRSINIDLRDPEGLLDKINEFKRYLNRSETLFIDVLTSSSKPSKQWKLFCDEIATISNGYLVHSEELQPSDAIAFKMTSEFKDDEELKSIFTTIGNYYSQGNNQIHSELALCLIDSFVQKSQQWKDADYLPNSLTMLRNASLFSGWFEVQFDQEHNKLFQEIIGGLASAYLKVGNMALSNGGVKSANRYIEKSSELIISNLSLFENLQSLDSSVLEIISLQNNVALGYANKGAFKSSFFINNLNGWLCNNMLNESCIINDSIRGVIERDYLHNQINMIGVKINESQYPDAVEGYFALVDSLNTFRYTKDFNLVRDSIADTLCSILYEQSTTLLMALQPTTALEQLLLAHKIQYVAGIGTKETEVRIRAAGEPVILEIIESARFSTWKNDLDAAEYGLAQAKKYNVEFLSSSSEIVNSAIKDLQNQMNTRICVDIKNNYNDALKTASILIRDKKYVSIPDLVRKANNYLIDYKDCNLDESLLESFVYRNSILINYLFYYDTVRMLLVEMDYGGVIESYGKLTEYYLNNSDNLKEVRFHPLEEFIVVQNLWALSIRAVDYFNQKGDYDIALYYLKLALNQGLDSKLEKEMIIELAVNLAVRDNELGVSARESIRTYSEGLEGMGYFKMAYIKNRVMGPSK